MMPTVNGVMLVISSSLAASIVAKVTVTTALGLFAAWLARGQRAAVRHSLLAAIFGVMSLLPIASVFMPPLHVGVAIGVESHPVLPPFETAVAAEPFAMTAGGVRTRVTPAAPRAPFNLLLAGWAAGTVLFLLPVVVGLWQIRSLRRSGLPWRHGQSVAKALALDAGIHRRVEVLLHEALPGPMTCGVVHPAIILPRDAECWNQEDLNRAIIHELEHVRRGDSVTRCLARAACAVYWFHPLVWIAWRRLVLEAERSCDDAVLGGSEATAYADQLVGLAKRLSMAKRSPAVAMANRIDLATRVGAVLDVRQRRGRAGTLSVALACGAAAVLVIVISPLKLIAAPQAAPSAALKFEVASIRACDGGGGPNERGGGGRSSPGRLTLTCQSVSGLIDAAYVIYANGVDAADPGRVYATPVEGGPGWINSERYTINAKAEGNASDEMMQGPMLQSLLEDRFKLKIRRETREVPVYALTVAKGGPKLQSFKEGTCVPEPEVITFPPTPPPAGQRYCERGGRPGGPNRVLVQEGITLDELCKTFLGGPVAGLGRRVIDRTGLSGKFNIHLEFAPSDEALARLRAKGKDNGEPTAPPLPTALEEQLGLKLESTKGPGEFYVIEHVERPSEN